MVAEPSELGPDRYYSPDRVRDLLRLYPYLLDRHPPADPDLVLPLRRALGPGGWREEAMARRADIARALAWLAEERDWRAACTLRACYAVGLPLRAIAAYLGVHHETVRRWRDDGIELLAWYLGWRRDAP